MKCPLCSHEDHSLFDQDKLRKFYKCNSCALVFVPRDSLISSEDEKKRYDTHNNTDEDPRYEAYLKKISDSVLPHVQKDHKGLDFGCGDSQLLQTLFQRSGLSMDSYDLYFLPDEQIWTKSYDFIVMSEVIEHLRGPMDTMNRLNGLLTPRGQFFIKTKLYPEDVNQFKNWFYKRDPTHIQFFSEQSFEVLSQSLGMKKVESVGEDLFLIKR